MKIKMPIIQCFLSIYFLFIFNKIKMNNLGKMAQTFNKIFYLGSFCSENPFQEGNGNNSSTIKSRQKSFEECLVDHLEMAQLNGLFPPGDGLGVDIEVDQNCIRLHNANSPFPFERIPLHKIVHFVVYSNAQLDGVNAALMENGPISGQNRFQRSKMEFKFHLFRSQNGGGGEEEMKKFCDKLQAKFDEISQKVTRIEP